jgi:hypothetical protein
MKPKLFIGSSIEARPAAKQVQEAIHEWWESDVWTDGFFQPGGATADTIERKIRDYDGGIFLLSPDDLLLSRGAIGPAPRANVLFELGMFAGVLGLSNCIQLVLKPEPTGWVAPLAYARAAPAPGPTSAAPSPTVSTSASAAASPPVAPPAAVGAPAAVAPPAAVEPAATSEATTQPTCTPTVWKPHEHVEPISDLNGITYIELRARTEFRSGRRNFELTPDAVTKLREEVERLRDRHGKLLGSTIGDPPSDWVCIWRDGCTNNKGDAEACVFGDRVRARYVWPGDGRRYEVSLRLLGGGLLSGQWRDPHEVGYSGSAQFQVRTNPPYLLGEWLGWSTNGGVKSGLYLLARRGLLDRALADARRVELARGVLRVTRRLPFLR